MYLKALCKLLIAVKLFDIKVFRCCLLSWVSLWQARKESSSMLGRNKSTLRGRKV